jgi:hypothetical protein
MNKRISKILYYINIKPTFKPNFYIVKSSTKEVLLANMINDYRLFHDLHPLKMEVFNNNQAINRCNEYIGDPQIDEFTNFKKEFKLIGLELVNSVIIDDYITNYQNCFQHILKNTVLKLVITNPDVKYLGISIKIHTKANSNTNKYLTFSLVLSK